MHDFVARTIAAAILAPYRLKKTDLIQGQCFLSPIILSKSREGILTECWMRTQTPTSSEFLNVSDRLNEIKRYTYTGTIPTYREIEETEAVNRIIDWFNKFYIYVPSKLDNVNFYKSFMVY